MTISQDQLDSSNSLGRIGQSIGLTGTELPSIAPDDHMLPIPGMILNIEPGTAAGFL